MRFSLTSLAVSNAPPATRFPLSTRPAGVLTKRIQSGEAADVIILALPAFAPLVKDKKALSGGLVRVARSPLAVAVRAGAPKPDISTVEAVKRTLLNAKSITYPDPTKGGGIGVGAARAVERLGLTDQLKSKTILTVAGEFRDLVVNGQAELAIVLPVAILDYPAIDLVGALPEELQTTDFDFMAAIGTGPEADRAQALIQYLRSPAAAGVMKSKGLMPG